MKNSSSKTVTVATTTYNRSQLLRRLYDSLLEQSSYDFCWLVIDDGSTDETAELIRSFQKEDIIPIKYVKKENGGFPSAQNEAVAHCDTPLYFEVDSDDYLPQNSIEEIASRYKEIKNDERIAGFLGLNQTPDGKILGKPFPEFLTTTTFWNSYYKYHLKNDLAVVFKTAIRKRYKFDLFKGEKEMGATYVHYKIDGDFEMKVIPCVIKTVDYQDSGLSANSRKLPKKNPHNYMKNKLVSIERTCNPILLTEFLLLFLVAALYAGHAIKAINNIEGAGKRFYAYALIGPAYLLKVAFFK